MGRFYARTYCSILVQYTELKSLGNSNFSTPLFKRSAVLPSPLRTWAFLLSLTEAFGGFLFPIHDFTLGAHSAAAAARVCQAIKAQWALCVFRKYLPNLRLLSSRFCMNDVWG